MDTFVIRFSFRVYVQDNQMYALINVNWRIVGKSSARINNNSPDMAQVKEQLFLND